MSKPSERIKEIKKEILEKYPLTYQATNFDMIALIQYLDEEYEKKMVEKYGEPWTEADGRACM